MSKRRSLRNRTGLALFAGAAATVTGAAIGCGTSSGSGTSVFAPPGTDGGNGATADVGETPVLLGDATTGGADTGDTACKNLQCKQVACTGSAKTTVSGTVYDPAGKNPMYNAIVYVPNAPLDAIVPGVSCDRCGELTSGAPLVVALTGADGKFTLENVPVGDGIPLVVQLGRWRRQITLPTVAACTETLLNDHDLVRLPKNQSEGDLPRMAIATGSADPFECLLRKIGIDDVEFTPNTGAGRVHYYVSNGVDTNPPSPTAGLLWGDPNMLRRYDMIMLPCEGGPNVKGPQATQDILDYTAAGGRVFTTHYGYVWIFDAQAPWPQTGSWQPEQNRSDTDLLVGNIDTSFPKGKAMADWLTIVGASTTVGHGRISIKEWRHDLNQSNYPLSQKWITSNTIFGPDTFPDSVQHMTFNTPVNAPLDDAGQPLQCGRVVYSDFHVSATDAIVEGAPFFPQSCKSSPMSDQEKALEFMFFDLASCVQKDDQPPAPPPPIR